MGTRTDLFFSEVNSFVTKRVYADCTQTTVSKKITWWFGSLVDQTLVKIMK